MTLDLDALREDFVYGTLGTSQLDALIARVRELEGALDKYGWHTLTCSVHPSMGERCNCGYTLLTPTEEK